MSTKGFTLIELLVVLVVVVVALGVVAGLASKFGGDHEAAEETAFAYATELGVPVKAVSCTGIDSDGDGYVSCTIMRHDTEAPMMVECAGAWTWSSGCRAPKAVIRSNW